jgi:MraZ protein
MEKLTGRKFVTLDEKGRISLPVHLRKVLGDSNLTLLPCDNNIEDCLWLIPTNVYQDMLDKYSKTTNILSKDDRDFRRSLYVSDAVEIDKAGRILILPEFRQHAKLTKDCVVLGQGEWIEIWDKDEYFKYYSESRGDIKSISDEISIKLKNKCGDQE